jgi:hypothetical protein
MQTLTPSRTGILTRAGFTTFQNVQPGLLNAPLAVTCASIGADPVAKQTFPLNRLTLLSGPLIAAAPYLLRY